MNDFAPRSVNFRGWQALELRNTFVRLVAVPAIGGRIMALDLGPHPFLFVDRTLAGRLFSPEENQGDGSLAAWKNYGGDKTWPAPQGWEGDDQWHGPPDPVLDSGRFRVEPSPSEDSLRMVSPPDPRTGLQIVRQATLVPDSGRVRLALAFRNVSDRPVRWSIWDVVQLSAETTGGDGKPAHDPTCVVTTPAHPGSRFPGGFQVLFGDPANPQWTLENGLVRAAYQWQIGKIGVDSQAGWIAFHQGSTGMTFVENFVVEPGAEYPDGGATVECWTVGAGRVANLDYTGSGIFLMETEVLGPMRTIDAGGESAFAIEWGVCTCPGTVVDVQPAGCVSRPLAATPLAGDDGDAWVRLRGEFGVFDAGELVLSWLGAGERRVDQTVLAQVDPLGAVHVDRVARAPRAAEQVILSVRARSDGIERTLARTEIVADSPADLART